MLVESFDETVTKGKSGGVKILHGNLTSIRNMANLEELKRQRKLVAEHLAWLESEIRCLETGLPTKEQGEREEAPSVASALSGPSTADPIENKPNLEDDRGPAPRTGENGPTEVAMERMIEAYQQEASNSPDSARKGCLTVFWMALGGLALVLLAIYFLKYF